MTASKETGTAVLQRHGPEFCQPEWAWKQILLQSPARMRHPIREVLDFNLQNWEMVGVLQATKFGQTCYSSTGAKKNNGFSSWAGALTHPSCDLARDTQPCVYNLRWGQRKPY